MDEEMELYLERDAAITLCGFVFVVGGVIFGWFGAFGCQLWGIYVGGFMVAVSFISMMVLDVQQARAESRLVGPYY